MPVITICSSAYFYKEAIDIEAQLENLGVTVLLPETAKKMKQSGDFDVSHYSTWLKDPKDYHNKSAFIRAHFEKIEKGDAILVLNYEKNGKQNYIGGNVLMEMSLAFYLQKPIYIFNEIPEDSPFVEEIKAFEPIVLHGSVETMSKTLTNL